MRQNTNPFYDEELAKAWADVKAATLPKVLYFIAGVGLLLVFFAAGAAMEHYYPELLVHIW